MPTAMLTYVAPLPYAAFIKSAITFGKFDIAAVAICYAVALGLLAWVGWRLHLHWPFYAGLITALGIAAYHLWLIRNREPRACFRAFLHNAWLGAAIFAGIVVNFLI